MGSFAICKIIWKLTEQFNYLKIDPNNQKLLGIRGSSMKEKCKLQESHQEKVRMKKKNFTLGCRRIPTNQFRPVKQKLSNTSAHACRVRAILIRMTLKWKRANITETTNERKKSDLIGLSNGYGRLVGWLSEPSGEKTSCPKTFNKLTNTSLWCHTATRLANRTSVFFFWRENKEVIFLSFHPLADKTNNEHLPISFFKVTRKSL